MKEQYLACFETIPLLEHTGSTPVSDGEQRKSTVATNSMVEALTALSAMGCDEGEGYYFAKPSSVKNRQRRLQFKLKGPCECLL